ncbi:MAG: sulfatase [Paludibacteraceae bacterium]
MKYKIIPFKKISMFSAATLTATALQAQVPKNPNIVVFLVDDMGWQDTSLPFWSEKTSLNENYETPNMERLAKHGVKFTQAYACAVSTPTRVSLMTGMNQARHRVTSWTAYANASTDGSDTHLSWPAWNVNGLQPDSISQGVYATTLPQILKNNGYATIHVGKAHFGANGTLGANPLNIGFTENVGGTAAGHPGSYYGTSNYSNGSSLHAVPDLTHYWGTNTYLTEALTLEAIKRMDTARVNAKPFYLYMAHYAIHAPIQRDERFYQKYIDKELPAGQAAYASMIEGMDKSLGDIMDYLETNNLTDSTIILFMSDNGGYSGAFSLSCSDASHCHNLPLKSGKGSIYEGGIREPMIVRWPGVTQDNTTCNNYVHIVDYFPTILEMAGISNYNLVQTIDGVSFAPLLKGEANANPTRDLIWHFPNKWGGWDYGSETYSAIRSGDYKLIYRWHTSTFELYNITEDIGESNNILLENVDVAKPLITRLSDYLRSVDAQRPAYKDSGSAVLWPDEVDIEI